MIVTFALVHHAAAADDRDVVGHAADIDRAGLFQRVLGNAAHHTGLRIAHDDLVARHGEARTRIVPVAVHGIGLGHLGAVGHLGLQNVELMERAVLRQDVAETGIGRIERKIDAPEGQFDIAEMRLVGGIDDDHTLGAVIAEENLHAFRANQRAGAFAGGQVGWIVQHGKFRSVAAGLDGQNAFLAAGSEIGAGKGLAMNRGAGLDVAGRRAVLGDRLQADALRRRVAFARSIRGDARDPGLSDRRSIAVMGAGLGQARRVELAFGKFMRVDDLGIAAAVEIDHHLAGMIDDVERARTVQGLAEGFRILDIDVGMIAMRMERDAAVDEVDLIVIGLDGDDRRAFVDAVELALTLRLEGPAIVRRAQIEGGDLRVGMIADEDAIEGDVLSIVLLCQRTGRHDEREGRCGSDGS